MCVGSGPPTARALPRLPFSPLCSQPWTSHKEGASKCLNGWSWYAHFYLNNELFWGRTHVIFPLGALLWNKKQMVVEWMNDCSPPSPAHQWKQKTHGPSHSTMNLPRSWESLFFCRFYHAFQPALKSQWLCMAMQGDQLPFQGPGRTCPLLPPSFSVLCPVTSPVTSPVSWGPLSPRPTGMVGHPVAIPFFSQGLSSFLLIFM